MRLWYYKGPAGNFGDDLNPWMWPQIFGRPLDELLDPSHVLIGVGSILDDTMLGQLEAPPEKWVVMGSGAGYGLVTAMAPGLRRCPRIFVRGPHTAAVIGLPPDKAIVDAGVLVSRLPVPDEPRGPRHQVAVLLHHEHHKRLGIAWARLCGDLGWHYVDVARSPKEVLHQLRHAELVISESMHGAICADALGVPWIPFATSPHVNLFKWKDWSASVSLPMEMNWTAELTLDRRGERMVAENVQSVARQLRLLYERAPRYLSSRQKMASLTGRVLDFSSRLLS